MFLNSVSVAPRRVEANTLSAIVNAAVMPASGLVLLYSGIFDHAVKSEDELAAVLAHEIAHVLANHVKEARTVGTVAGVCSLPFMLPLALLHFVESLTLVALASPLIPIIGSFLLASRIRESEADRIGMMLMADAGFDPSAAVSVWKNMKKMEDRRSKAQRDAQDPQWLSTHPHVRMTLFRLH